MKLNGALRRLLGEATNLGGGGTKDRFGGLCDEHMLDCFEVQLATRESIDGIVVRHVEVLDLLKCLSLQVVGHQDHGDSFGDFVLLASRRVYIE